MATGGGDPYSAGAMAGFQIIAGLQQAEMIRANAKLTKQISDMNAQYADIDAHNAEVDGYTNEARYLGQVQGVEANQRAAFAAQDVDASYGTAAQVQKETELTGFLNSLDIKNQAHQKALGYTQEARNIRLKGAMGQVESETRASATQSAAFMNAGATAISGYSRK